MRAGAPRWAWFLLLATGCGAPLQALDPDVDVQRLAADLTTGPADANGFVAATWLCLLHGHGCERLPTAAPPPGEPGSTPSGAVAEQLAAQLAAALAADAAGPIAPRLAAWLALADRAATPAADGDARADRLLSLAVAAVGRLALRDHACVAAALAAAPPRTARWLTVGAAAERWRRLRVLTQLGHAPEASPLQPLPLRVELGETPLSRRLFTGLDRVPDVLPATFSGHPLAAVVSDSDQATADYALPARDAGVYWLRARAASPADQRLLLLVEATRPVRVWCDGKPVARLEPGDADDRPEMWLTLTQGEHVLDFAVPVGQNAEILTLGLVSGAPAGARRAAVGWHPTLDAVIDVLRQPDGAAAEPFAARFPHELLVAHAAVARADLRAFETLPTAGAVDALLGRWPQHADAQLARVVHTRESGQVQLALAALGQLEASARGETAPASLPQPMVRADVALERARIWLALGLSDLGVAAAEEASTVGQPDDCKLLIHALVLAQDAADRPALRRLLDRRLQCSSARLPIAFAQSAAGRLPAAFATLTALMSEPQHARQAAGLAHILAQTLNRSPPPSPPWQDAAAERLWQEAQEAELRGDSNAVQAALHRLLTASGLPLPARQQAIQAGVRPIWQPFVRDGEVIARQTVTDDFAAGSATVWLLDQEIVQLLPDGGALRRVHQVVRVREDAAAETVGEIRVDDGAELELARTLLPDGTVVWPAETSDKESISLRAVAADTTVEFAQVAYVPPDDPATGATRLPLFQMQSPEAPVRLAEYVVLVPVGLAVQWTASPSAGLAEKRELPGFTAHIYRRADLPRVRAEPRAVRPERFLPSVRVMARSSLAAVIEPWHEALAAYVQSRDPLLRTWRTALARFPDGLSRWQQLASRLALSVQHAHEGAMPGRPETALSAGKGDRASVFFTLARQLGADACLVRVLPLARLPAADPLDPATALDPEDYGLELVRVQLRPDSPALWYDPALDGGRLNHVRSGLRGRSGLLTGCALTPPDPRVTVPPLGEGDDRRDIAVSLTWAADGRLDAVVREDLAGTPADSVRAFLRGNGANHRELVQQLANGVFNGAALELLDIRGLGGDGPLHLAYEATLTADRARTEALDLDLWAEQLSQTYAALPARTTPLLFGHALARQVTVRVLHGGDTLADLPLDVAVAEPRISYSRQVRQEAGAVTLSRVLRAQPGVIAPDAYAAFAQTLRRIDAADHVRLRRTP